VLVVAPRTRPSGSSSSVTSSRPPPSETSPRLLSTPVINSLSSMPSFTTASRVLSTPRWSGTGRGRPVRTGEKLEANSLVLVTHFTMQYPLKTIPKNQQRQSSITLLVLKDIYFNLQYLWHLKVRKIKR